MSVKDSFWFRQMKTDLEKAAEAEAVLNELLGATVTPSEVTVKQLELAERDVMLYARMVTFAAAQLVAEIEGGS